MRRAPVLLVLAVLCTAAPMPAAAGGTDVAASATGRLAAGQANIELNTGLADAGLAFTANAGQWEPEVRFRAELGGAVLWVTDDAVVYDFSVSADRGGVAEATAIGDRDNARQPVARRGHVVAMRFDGAQSARAVGHGERADYRNYFLGADPSRWASRVPVYDEVLLEGLYDGVDLRLYSDEGLPRYDLVLAPGADLSQVRIRLDGADDVTVAPDGTVSMQTSLGPVEQRGLLAYQQGTDGERRVLPSAFRLAPDGSLGFSVQQVDEAQSLVIDPLIWSTFLGGSHSDFPYAVALRPDGSVVVAGDTYSQSFPTTPGAYDTVFSGETSGIDGFVSVLSADGRRLIYSTFLGGGVDDQASAAALGSDGSITLTGDTSSNDFPVTPGAYDTTYNGRRFFGGDDAFVTRLSADGTRLVYSTFLGGTNREFTHELALAADGSAIVAGTTDSKKFPVKRAYDSSYNGAQDAFVARISADGRDLLYSTFLGGTGSDGVRAIDVGPDGTVTVAGRSGSPDFPVTPDAYDGTGDSGNGFVTRFAPDGATLEYSTSLGGTGGESVYDLRLGPDGSMTIVGRTASADFPTTPGAYDQSQNGAEDAYVARLSADGASLDYSTFLGGSGYDNAAAVALGPDGSVVIAGEAGSTSGQAFPTTPDAYDRLISGSSDAYVARLSPDGNTLLYSTLIGGSGGVGEYASALALGADGSATVTGYTNSSSFPTTPGAYRTTAPAGGDAFVTRLPIGLG